MKGYTLSDFPSFEYLAFVSLAPMSATLVMDYHPLKCTSLFLRELSNSLSFLSYTLVIF